jgi:hypothetical protein
MSPNGDRTMRYRRLPWIENKARMVEERIAHKILVWKLLE